MGARCRSCRHLQCSKFSKLLLHENYEHLDNDYQSRILVPFIAYMLISPRVLRLSECQYLKTMNNIGYQYEVLENNIPFSDVLHSIKLVKVEIVETPQFVSEIDTSLNSYPFQGEQVHLLSYSSVSGWYTELDYETREAPMQKLQMGWSWLY